MVAMTTSAFYLITVYAPTFGKTVLNLSTTDALLVTLLVGVSNFFWLPIGGTLSDRFGRKPMLIAMTVLTVFTAYPALSYLAQAASFAHMLEVLLWFSFLYAMYNGAMIPALTEIMPEDVKVAGFSLAYSLATALFGGFTPAMSTWLIHETGDKAAPAYWVTFAALCALSATLVLYRKMAVRGLDRKWRCAAGSPRRKCRCWLSRSLSQQGGGHGPEPCLLLIQDQRCLGAFDQQCRVQPALRAEAGGVDFGQADQGLDHADVDFQQACAVTSDQGEEVVEQVVYLNAAYMHAPAVCVDVIGVGGLKSPFRETAHPAPHHIDDRTGVIGGRGQGARGDLCQHRQAETRVLIEGAAQPHGDRVAQFSFQVAAG